MTGLADVFARHQAANSRAKASKARRISRDFRDIDAASWPSMAKIYLKEHVEGRPFFLKAPKGRHIQTCIPTAYVLEYSVKGPTSEPFLGWLSGWWFHGLILFWSFPTTQGYSPNTYFCWPQSTLRKGFLSEESLDHDDWDNHPPLYLILEGETANKL